MCLTIPALVHSPLQVPSGVLNRGEAAVLANSLQRMPSGNIYDGFPCVRIGDFLLPSSMDLRMLLACHPIPCLPLRHSTWFRE